MRWWNPVSTVLGGLILYPRDYSLEVLKFFRDFTQSAPEELTTYAALMHTPDGMPVVGIVACYCGDLATGEEVLKPLRKFGFPLVDTIQPLPFPQMQTLLDGACPDGNQNYWKSTFLRGYSDEALTMLIEQANLGSSPLNTIILEFYGGAVGRVGVSDTAFGQRKEQYFLIIMAQWTDPADSHRHIEWARCMADAMRPFASGGNLLNSLGEESHQTIKSAFGINYGQLIKVKKKYDPTNFFRLNQNIKIED